MKYSRYSLLVLLFLVFIFQNSYSQGPGSLFVDAGPPVTADCSTGGCVDITATFLETFDTSGSNYVVNSVPYNPPFAFDGLANPLNPNIDDEWSDVDTLPFDFCFFGNLVTEFQVGSNGVIRFDVDPGDATNDWIFDDNLPSNTQDALGEANIFTPVHDIDPTESFTEEIGYEVLGNYPNRVLVVSYFEVPMYSCNSLLATHMAVFYEFSNVVEIYIQDKPVCPNWNGGNAALGIQNNAGDTGYVPPGRNTSDSPWTATNEAWSFSPVGPETYVFEWLDSTGTVIGNNPTINVCPASGVEIFTARITYSNTCNGQEVVLEDTVIVTNDSLFTVDLGPDMEVCLTNPIDLDASADAPVGSTYEWFLGGISQGPASTLEPTYTVNFPNSGTYSVDVIDPTDPTCTVNDSVIITFTIPPQIASPPEDLFQCDDGTNTGIFDFADNTDLVLGTQDPLDVDITYHNTALDAQTGAAPIAPNAYPITGEIEEVFVRIASESIVEDIIFLEDFGTGLGRVTHPYTSLIFNATTTLVANQYAVTNISTGLNDGWHIDMEDHTLGDTNGRMIFFDNPVPPSNPEIYRRSIPVTANTDFVFDFAMTSLYDTDNTICGVGQPGAPSNLTYRIEDAAGTVLATNTTGDVVNQSNPNWNNFSLNFNSGVNTEVQIVFINNITETCGGDFALDDIKIFKFENCFDTASFFIEFLPVAIGAMTDEPICDADADGSVTINLPLLKDLEALNGLDPLLYTVSYYGSQADADNGGPVLPNPYTITNPTEEFFVRLENNANPTCFVTDSFEVFITPLLIALPPTPIIKCDEFPNNGYAEFDLTTRDLQIIGGVDPNAVLTYHLTFADAEAGVNAIDPVNATAFENTIPSFQTIYPRLENLQNPDCYTTTELVLQVDQAPAITDPITDYFLCDDASGDGVEVFNLLSRNLEILNTQLGINLGYYSSQADAEAQPPINIIINPDSYPSSGEEIWVRADNSAGCVTVLSFNLVVGEIPSDFTVVPIFEQCDDLILDGVTEFDLNTQNPLITGGSSFLNVSYYVSQTDADTPTNPLVSPYTNITDPETIFVRVEDNTTGCHDTFLM
ncbi:hypothetical protein OAE13_02920, partial [Flavobacteriaceae bacterium]|nr:hypothetical protein [Flavobacteriaceae bacterium]